ncbi:MAG: YfiR family protein [Saprospiraceae bacterium]|nr:YfiR family protein [Saprospiraceae bacterium]
MHFKKKIHLSNFIIIILMVMGFVFSFQKAHSQTINYKSQSLFIYKFTKYIYWPEDKTKGDFIIGVYGNSPIYEELLTMASLKKAGKGQNIIIRKINSIENMKGLHMIYITSSKSREIKKIVAKFGDYPTLIVAERGGLARKGASINFMIMENDVLKFEYNANQMKKLNLRISKDLSKLGFKVG